MSSTDDDISKALGRYVREQEEAMNAEAWDDEPLGPLSDDEQARLTESILRRLEVGDASSDAASDARRGGATRRSGKVVPLRPRGVRRWPVAVVTVSAAAAALLLFWPRTAGTELATYALVPPPPDAAHRDSTATPPASEGAPDYVLGRELEVLLRPATRVDVSVDARVLIEREGELEPLAVTAEPAAGGAVVFRIPTGRGHPLGEAGTIRLHFVLGSVGRMPEALRSLEDLPSGVQHLPFDLRLTADTEPQ